mgnify:CR=1 FL=1
MKYLCSFSLITLLFSISSCHKEPKPLNLPQGLEVIASKDNATNICFDCENQVVIYLNTDKLSLHALSEVYGWADTKEKYPAVSFIFYLSGKDKEKIKQGLSNLHFPFPVLYDPFYSFFQLNKLDTVSLDNKNLLPFLIKNHQVKGLAQIGIIDLFHQQLEESINEN